MRFQSDGEIICHSDSKESKSKYKGGFVNGKNTPAYNHDYYLRNKDKWEKYRRAKEKVFNRLKQVAEAKQTSSNGSFKPRVSNVSESKLTLRNLASQTPSTESQNAKVRYTKTTIGGKISDVLSSIKDHFSKNKKEVEDNEKKLQTYKSSMNTLTEAIDKFEPDGPKAETLFSNLNKSIEKMFRAIDPNPEHDYSSPMSPKGMLRLVSNFTDYFADEIARQKADHEKWLAENKAKMEAMQKEFDNFDNKANSLREEDDLEWEEKLRQSREEYDKRVEQMRKEYDERVNPSEVKDSVNEIVELYKHTKNTIQEFNDEHDNPSVEDYMKAIDDYTREWNAIQNNMFQNQSNQVSNSFSQQQFNDLNAMSFMMGALETYSAGINKIQSDYKSKIDDAERSLMQARAALSRLSKKLN